MRVPSRRVTFSLFAPACIVACASLAQAQVRPPALPSADAPLVFRGVTVIDVKDGKRLPGQTVTIVGHRIRTVEPDGNAHLAQSANVVDATGKFLMPGLWDMHVHVQDYPDLVYPLLIANGVTGIRDPGSPVPLATLGEWKRAIAAGTTVGPRLLVSGPALDEAVDSTQIDVKQEAHQFISVPRAALPRVVDSLKAAGADLIKTYSLSRIGYFLATGEAKRMGLLIGGHLPIDENNGNGMVDGREASDSGATFLDHGPMVNACGFDSAAFDLAACRNVAARYRRNNSWVTVASQVLVTRLAGQRGSEARNARINNRMRRYLPHSFARFKNGLIRDQDSTQDNATAATVPEPEATADWVASTPNYLVQWCRAGLPMVLGTDTNLIPGMYDAFTPGFVQQEALLGFALSGMKPVDALRVGTLNPALALRAADSLGTVAAGKLADLVLLDADPLADVWNTSKIRGVVANGRYYDRTALDGLLADAERIAKRR